MDDTSTEATTAGLDTVRLTRKAADRLLRELFGHRVRLRFNPVGKWRYSVVGRQRGTPVLAILVHAATPHDAVEYIYTKTVKPK